MKFPLQLAVLSLCCLLITVMQSDATFVPGRCLCPVTQHGVRGQLKDISVFPKSASCNKVTVIVTLRSTSETRCLNPDAPLGKQLVHCWNRAHRQGRDPKLCLRRRRGRGRAGPRQLRSRLRSRGQGRKSSTSSSQ